MAEPDLVQGAAEAVADVQAAAHGGSTKTSGTFFVQSDELLGYTGLQVGGKKGKVPNCFFCKQRIERPELRLHYDWNCKKPAVQVHAHPDCYLQIPPAQITRSVEQLHINRDSLVQFGCVLDEDRFNMLEEICGKLNGGGAASSSSAGIRHCSNACVTYIIYPIALRAFLPPCLGFLGQLTSKPTNQQNNRATNQLTNKPANQQNQHQHL
eukprot:5747141-Karenia_brevis.AAC.1